MKKCFYLKKNNFVCILDPYTNTIQFTLYHILQLQKRK